MNGKKANEQAGSQAFKQEATNIIRQVYKSLQIRIIVIYKWRKLYNKKKIKIYFEAI